MKEREKNSLLSVMVDRSGSMAGWAIKAVKESAIKFGKEYFERVNRSNINLTTMLFNDKNLPVTSNSYNHFENFMN